MLTRIFRIVSPSCGPRLAAGPRPVLPTGFFCCRWATTVVALVKWIRSNACRAIAGLFVFTRRGSGVWVAMTGIEHLVTGVALRAYLFVAVIALNLNAAGQQAAQRQQGKVILNDYRVKKGWISLHPADSLQAVMKIRVYADSTGSAYDEYGPAEASDVEITGGQRFMATPVLNHCAHLDSTGNACKDTLLDGFYLKVEACGAFILLSQRHTDHLDYYLQYIGIDTFVLHQLLLPRTSKDGERSFHQYIFRQQLLGFAQLAGLTPTWSKYMHHRIFHVAAADIAGLVHDLNLATEQSFKERQTPLEDKDSSSISVLIGGALGRGKLYLPLGRPSLRGPVTTVIFGGEYVGTISKRVELRARAHLCWTHHQYPDFDFTSLDPGVSFTTCWTYRKSLYMFLGLSFRAYSNWWSDTTRKRIVSLGMEDELNRYWTGITWKAGIILKRVGIEIGIEGVIVSEMSRRGFPSTPGGMSLAVAKHFEFPLRKKTKPRIGPLEND